MNKIYEVEINGLVHTMRLDAEDVERYKERFPVRALELKERATPQNKARTTANK